MSGLSRDLRKEVVIICPVKEIAADDNYGIQLDSAVIKEMTEGDADPQFVVVEIDEGKSKNNIHYDRAFLEDVAQQINKNQPVGYLGHKHFQGLDKEDLLPPPQTVWVGATVVTNADGKAQLRVKGYNLPDSKVREWIKRKAVNSVSWAGDAVLTPAMSGGYKVKEYFLESLDWSRKNKEGVRNRVLATVTEMDGGIGVTAEEIASLQLAELQQNNPGLIATIENNAKALERQAVLKEMETKTAELETQHETAIKELPEVKELTKLRAFLKLDDNSSVFDMVTALYEKAEGLAKKEIQTWFKDKLMELVPNEKARGLVERLVPVTEMEGHTFIDNPDEIKKGLEDSAKTLVDSDDDIKTIIKEMGSSRGGLNLAHQHQNGNENNNNNNNNNNNDDDRYKDSENLTVETVQL